MRHRVLKLFRFLLLAVFLLVPEGVPADPSPQTLESPGVEAEAPPATPDLADLIPMATELAARLAALEKYMVDGSDVSPEQETLSAINENLDKQSARLKGVEASGEYSYLPLIELKTAVNNEGDTLKKINKPLARGIGDLGSARKQWLKERKQWQGWQSALLKDEPLEEVKTIIAGVNVTIDASLDLIGQQLTPMLARQQKVADLQVRINALVADVDNLIKTGKGIKLADTTPPPMFSERYRRQLRTSLWNAENNILIRDRLSVGAFFERQGWLVACQFILTIILVIVIFYHRNRLANSERWRFVARRPFATGLFAGFVPFNTLYVGAPITWEAVVRGIVVISFARLFGGLLEKSWKLKFIYTLAAMLVVTRLLMAAGLSLPMFRLYLVLAAGLGLLLCLWMAMSQACRRESQLYTWGGALGACLFTVILIAEFWGQTGLAELLFLASVRTVLLVLGGWLLAHLARGALEWAFHNPSFQRVSLVHTNTAAVVHRLIRLSDVFIGVLVLSSLLVTWRVYDSPVSAVRGLLSFGFNLGPQRISVGLVLVAVAIVYGAFFASWAVQRLLVEGTLTKRQVGIGVKTSISRLIHYALVCVGFMLALTVLGFDLTKLTILFSALGIGIGFGLQGVVNNFICGLILLFERPVRVGDYIEIEGKWAEIKKIGLRSTTVLTFDRADVIIPNADLISNQVTNWTLTDRQVRLIIKVGVAYGSDVPLVIETLMQCTVENPDVTRTPAPQVLFTAFGESALNFELRVYTAEVNNRMQILSDLHQDIDKRFRQAGIEIAFPQRDLHVRSVAESISLAPMRSD